MPEIAEVARIVHYLRQSLVGKTIASVKALDDANIFGKVGTSGAEFQRALTGKKVLDANQQGKYFWLILSSPPHPLFHFGMTGWMHIRGSHTYYYRKSSEEEEAEQWPPRFWKFRLETTEDPKVEVAFTDARRFARIRLIHCKAEDIRNTTPLKENGPDPIRDKDILTAEWLEAKLKAKHVPIKALLLDQANISGLGNWVGDEILYHAKLHPEQYSDTFNSKQIKQLHASIMYVCQTAVNLLSDSEKFPEEWLFKHRWGKGKKDVPKTLPNGNRIMFLTVGGRTSCIVPTLQKKTGHVAGSLDGDGKVKQRDDGSEAVEVKAKGSSQKRKTLDSTRQDSVEAVAASTTTDRRRSGRLAKG